ncbi:MAG: cytochrome P450 [Xanthomonadaceae bacterium]|jgi:cytochrome P450|nr:cytochrome P450 [Xanthomonadaceae bacterium]
MTRYSDICNWLYRIARERNGENVETELNGVPVLVIQRLEDADHVLRLKADDYPKNMTWFRQTLGASRFSENGEAWVIRRDLSQPYFNRFDRDRALRNARKYALQALVEMSASGDQGAERLDDSIFRQMTASVLIESFFDVEPDRFQVDIRNLASLMELGSEYSFVPAGRTQTMSRDRIALLPGLRRQVFEDFKPLREGYLADNPLIAGMLAADQDPGNDIVLEHELLTFFAAGTETTAATISWAAYLLAAHPEVQQRLREETERLWNSGAHDWAALSRLELLEAFISETMRLFPATPILARLAQASDRIGDKPIEPGQNVLISLIGVQHDRRFCQDPWSLHLEKRKGAPNLGTGTAFSFGPRICGGKKFALVELAGVLDVFLRHGDFRLTMAQPPVFHWKSQMLYEGGQPVRVRLRD